MPYLDAVPQPQDRAFNGTIKLLVDASDVARRIVRVKQSIPLQAAGKLTLLYPQWEPSSHARTISAANLAGLEIRSSGHLLRWTRDAVDMHAFHVEVPPDASQVDVEFQYITRIDDGVIRPDMVNVQWQRVLVYPAGWFARNIPIEVELITPSGLKVVSGLATAESSNGRVKFKKTTLDILTDTPSFAARHVRTVSLSPRGEPEVSLHLLADNPESLAETGEDLAKLRQMIIETKAVMGKAPYNQFHAIVVLSDVFPVGGVEHANSAEVNLPAGYFQDQQKQLNVLDLIPHEYVHAWNGRLRQPADLWTPTLNVPIRNSLLWLYEGQTEFWSRVLAARSGIRTRQQTMDKLAMDAAEVQIRSGRAWKTLQDSTNDPLYVSGRSTVWPQWQRRKDYYGEGVLLWLDVDATLKDRSSGRVSLDDFARAFFRANHAGEVRTYTFDEVCKTLNSLVSMDWSAYLKARLDAKDALVLDGLTRAGWRLSYSPSPSETFLQHELELGGSNLNYSLGMVVSSKGVVRSVVWDSPAFAAGLVPGAKLTHVNGTAFTSSVLLNAVRIGGAKDLYLAFTVDGIKSEASLKYEGGLRYPQLTRIKGSADRITELLASVLSTPFGRNGLQPSK